jgi:N-dimethylarginine dimethylaminohydrolase
MGVHRDEFDRARFVISRPCCGQSCDRADAKCTFRVAWVINPHMQIGSVHGSRAVLQHDAFLRTLDRAGARLETIPFVHGAFDSVFTKDNAVLVEREDGATEALLARPRHAERQIEQRARGAALSALGVNVIAASDEPLEGGDIVMLPAAAGAFLGHGFRSTAPAARKLERFLGREVATLELRDPRLYHLDMALAVLDDGTALVCEEALSDRSHRVVTDHPAINQIIRVPLEEALRFGVNLVQIGDTVVWAADAPLTSQELSARGYQVRRVSLDQFHHAGGSAACLVSRVHRQAPDAMKAHDERRTAA